MIVAAALCASPPLLHPALTGRAVVLPELRAASAEAVARLLRGEPEVIVVVGPAHVTGEWGPDDWFDPAPFAPGVASGRATPDGAAPGSAGPEGAARGGTGTEGAAPGLLPLSLGLGVMLLDQGGYRGPRRLIAVGEAEPTGMCAALGAELATGATRTALLVMGDGSARRSLKAPGHLDPRAEPFDAHVERAVRTGRLGELLDLDEALARDLMATGRPAWQVLAGAMPGGTGAGRRDGAGADSAGPDGGSGADNDGGVDSDSGVDTAGMDDALATDVLYRDDPFGVAYLVASMHPRPHE